MKSINDLNLKDITAKALTGVFDDMVKMKIEEAPQSESLSFPGERVLGTVGFAGKVNGLVYIQVDGNYARDIAGSMLGLGPEDLGDAGTVNDVIGEVCNMVGGNLKSSLCDQGFPCALSVPSITRGTQFHMEVKDEARHESYIYKFQENRIGVDVVIKPGE